MTTYDYSGGEAEGLTMVIFHKETSEYFVPAVIDGLTWELHRKGAPGKVRFSVIADDALKIAYGDTIDITWQGTQFFHGFIFTERRTKDKIWRIEAYDQLRYLLNKTDYPYVNKTATEVIRYLAEDYELTIGELAETGFTIEKRREQNATIMDICQNALDLTMIHTDKMYVMYDECGKLMLKDVEDMKTDLYIDGETAQNFDYRGTIDKGVYNLIRLTVDEGTNGHRVVYAPASNTDYENSKTRKQWGVLEYSESINPKGQSPQQMANKLLEHYNRIKREFSIKKAFGDLRIKGGSMLYVNVGIGDSTLKEDSSTARLAIVEHVTHRFSNKEHTMDLELKGDFLNE
ncbi:MAG: hypothetical protein I3I94_09125 [Acidaminococcaceae bacterium]|nr:hypothetical protein [Acidaminococcaceae bacterium]